MVDFTILTVLEIWVMDTGKYTVDITITFQYTEEI